MYINILHVKEVPNNLSALGGKNINHERHKTSTNGTKKNFSSWRFKKEEK